MNNNPHFQGNAANQNHFVQQHILPGQRTNNTQLVSYNQGINPTSMPGNNFQNQNQQNDYEPREESSNDITHKKWEEHLQKQKAEFDDWKKTMNKLEPSVKSFKNQNLPLARIKKIMKSDEDVRMISADAPILFSQACEFFIRDLTYRARFWTKDSKRKTLQKNDIESCIKKSEIFDFLIDIIDKDDNQNIYKKANQLPSMIPMNMHDHNPMQYGIRNQEHLPINMNNYVNQEGYRPGFLAGSSGSTNQNATQAVSFVGHGGNTTLHLNVGPGFNNQIAPSMNQNNMAKTDNKDESNQVYINNNTGPNNK